MIHWQSVCAGAEQPLAAAQQDSAGLVITCCGSEGAGMGQGVTRLGVKVVGREVAHPRWLLGRIAVGDGVQPGGVGAFEVDELTSKGMTVDEPGLHAGAHPR